ncbi:family 43 glycosylhydrolase [Anaerocaecibacter muris]|uniref:family 43 glycosylhydrolase n=1 Tax=Anaerocaecibacter muris TaxID=2941513 RepID=UPI00203EF7DB|nr:family 43 glycosylhydrolase [Anaerocaecibacter muris]
MMKTDKKCTPKSVAGILSAVVVAIGGCLAFCACGEKPNSGKPDVPPDPPKVAVNNDYMNPIYPLHNGEKKPLYTADPYAIRGDDGKFYMYCTQTETYTDDSALAPTFKRGPIFVSDDCVNWTYKADVFQSYTPDWGAEGAGVWAPTVLKVGDYYNYYYSYSGGNYDNPEIGIGVARSQTPYGPWTHYGKLFNSGEIGVVNSIDPHVLYDNGKLYMVFGSYGGLITLVELEADGLSLKGGLDNQRENKVALAGFETYAMENYEASIILERDGKYYLFLSTGTTLSGLKSTYRVVVATSDSITGPYKDSKGRDMFGPNRGDYVVAPSMAGAMGVGHMCLIEDDIGDIWMLYHGYDTQADKNKEWRVLYLDKLIWGENGLPEVEDKHASNHEIKHGPYINALEQ